MIFEPLLPLSLPFPPFNEGIKDWIFIFPFPPTPTFFDGVFSFVIRTTVNNTVSLAICCFLLVVSFAGGPRDPKRRQKRRQRIMPKIYQKWYWLCRAYGNRLAQEEQDFIDLCKSGIRVDSSPPSLNAQAWESMYHNWWNEKNRFPLPKKGGK